MKLTVIGGGGVRSMFLAKSIAQRAEELHRLPDRVCAGERAARAA